MAIYRAKHSIFRVNHPDKEGALTPFTRALKTLQDRLVKELRLRSLRSIEPANALLPPPAVILGTPVVPAEGGTTGVSGIQRNKGNHLGTPAKHQQGLTGEKRLRRRPEQGGQLQAESNTLFYWIPACFNPDWDGENDGGRGHPHFL